MPRTVFLTGITGFIAKHVALKLLEAGHTVVGSTRSLDRAGELKGALRPHLTDPQVVENRLRLVALDLTQDAGWAEALSGADVLVHTASPFPMTQPKEEAALIRPAVDGARRALRGAQAAGIDRVVLTSSAVAVMNTELASGKPAYDEADWTDTAHPGVTAYEKSKTLAEQAAWDFVNDDAPGIALTVINPVLVLGAPLDLNYGTSVQVVERILKAQDPMLPRIGFPIVNVTDVAEMHLRAVDWPETAGKRYIAAEEFLWFRDIAEAIKAEYPGRKVVTREAPDLVVRALAVFDPAIRTVLPSLGKRRDVSAARARDEMGIAFTPAAESVRRSARFLVEKAGL
ncbi:NAD-dependent epimerase/dehydratase family protein [Salibaculum halophilum]|uniref:NAD-dependent epimerase/dehydratase family protein n=1 Tax=Salibaculum halophilum TaxID=1914408 RepID=UPI000A10935D|nr:NAD-dependent epimerase/dehydratase family protein [Salibaculum halophilum]